MRNDMQKTLIAVLLLLVLFLTAALVRVQSREHQLEERLDAAERIRIPKPAPMPTPVLATNISAPEVPVVPATPSKPPPLEEKITPPPQTRTSNPSTKVQTPGLTFSFSEDQLVLSMPEEPPLPEGRRPGYLGITGSDAEGGGVQVTQVQQGTVAGQSGLRVGDVILEVNGERVANYGDLAAKMRLNGEGGPVTLRIRRGATEFYQGAQLGPRPP
jgi:membrane-associated protease RseP (regulator of RpoE activity)